MPTSGGGARRGADFLRRRHGLDPDDVRAALLQPLDLLDEHLDRLVLGHRPERRQQIAGRPDRTGDDDRARRACRRRSARSRRRAGSVRACAPSRLCSMSRRRLPPKLLVRMMSAPASTKARCSARMRSGWSAFQSSGVSPGGEAHGEKVGAGRAVGEQRPAFGQQGLQHVQFPCRRPAGPRVFSVLAAGRKIGKEREQPPPRAHPVFMCNGIFTGGGHIFQRLTTPFSSARNFRPF